MARADYEYFINEGVVSIVDLDKGNKSLTNDIENVIEEVCLRAGIKPHEYKWVYRDSGGMWDGFDPATKQFIPLGTTDENDAIKLILKL